MLQRLVLACATAMAITSSPVSAQAQSSPNGVRTRQRPGAFNAEGTWSLGVRAGDFIFVAGMQGVEYSQRDRKFAMIGFQGPRWRKPACPQ